MPVESIRKFLIEQFQLWILPKSIRTDNGEPFGVPTRDVVPIMSLWLKAWGIIPILNRPRCPTDNPKVERGQGTTSRWAELEKCPDLATLQQRLDEACLIQREKYPVVRLGKVTRSQLHKSLSAKTRPFSEGDFDEKRAYEYLSMATMPRKVSRNGNITIYSKVFSIGIQQKGKVVMLKFSPTEIGWLVLYQSGDLCRFLPDSRFAKENLFNLKCQ